MKHLCDLTFRLFKDITCPSELLKLKTLALPLLVPHAQPAQASWQLLFSILQLGGSLTWLKLERHRWYHSSVSKHTRCFKPWSFCQCLQKALLRVYVVEKWKTWERHWEFKLFLLSSAILFPFFFFFNRYSVDSQILNSFPRSLSSTLKLNILKGNLRNKNWSKSAIFNPIK